MAALVGLIVACLVIGKGCSAATVIWGRTLAEWLGVRLVEPWLMTEADLTPSRVVYNWLTKPGFRWLLVDLVVMGLGVGVMGWLLGRLGQWVGELGRGLGRWWWGTVRWELSGSVRIQEPTGLIYAASSGGEVGEELGCVVAEVKVKILDDRS